MDVNFKSRVGHVTIAEKIKIVDKMLKRSLVTKPHDRKVCASPKE